MMLTRSLFVRSVILLGLFSASALAQPPTEGNSVEATYSFSGSSDVRQTGGAAELGVQRASIQASHRFKLDEQSGLRIGILAQNTWLDLTAALPLPDQLQAYALQLGYTRQLSAQWSLAVSAQPGTYGDEAKIGGGTFNVPVLLTGIYAQSRELAWVFGARYDGFADQQLLPFAGVRWQFAPAWTFELAFPRTGLTYRANERVSAGGYVGVQGGNYRVTAEVPRGVAGAPALGRTYLDYYEIRVGGGVDIALGKAASLRFEAGIVTNRTFDYYERNFRIKTADAPFGTIAWRAQF